jgi:Protein of unknown function (DUF3276)
VTRFFTGLVSPQNQPTVTYDNNEKKMESVYSKRIRAGKRRTYFFDVRATRSNDYYLTITESRKRFNDNGYDRHKIFLYKEDFNKFLKGMTEAIDYVKTDLMPDFDFDAFNHDNDQDHDYNGEHGGGDYQHAAAPVAAAPVADTYTTPSTGDMDGMEHMTSKDIEADATPTADAGTHEDVDKW